MSVRVKQSLKGKVIIGTVIENDNSTIILVDENGNEIAAVLVDEEVKLTATPNDIRIGATAITEDGITEGEKFIPPYYTSAGYRAVPNGKILEIPLPTMDAYDYTTLQCIICPFNTSFAKSVSAEKVVIENNLYLVNSLEVIASVTKNPDTKTIHLGIQNDTGRPIIIRYFTYKEEQ